METTNPINPEEEIVRIKNAEITLISIENLIPHPDNRPLGPSTDKIDQLKILIRNDGFDSSHPLVVRPFGEDFQIIEGEHRFHAAKELGFDELPSVIRELDDTEALIQLVLGNTQSENRPLEIGLNALKVVKNEGSYTTAAYAQRLGLGETSIRRYINASEVFQFLRENTEAETKILDEVHKLEEINRLPEEDWLWFHNLIQEKKLSKNQTIELSQAMREVKTDSIAVQGLFDLQKMRKEVAQAILLGDPGLEQDYAELLESTKKSYENLDDEITLYEYNVLQDEIEEEDLNLKEWFVASLNVLKDIDKKAVLETYKDALQMKRNGTQEEALRTAEYFRDKKHQEERQEQERIAKEMRQVTLGDWWRLGEHYLYCGEASSPVFRQKLPEQNLAFAFVNPPYKGELSTQENEEDTLDWTLDWLSEKVEIVAITPALHEVQSFLKNTNMPYRWSMACWLSGKTPGRKDEMFSSWIYTALFSKELRPQRLAKDFWKIEVKTGHQQIATIEHKGSKPYEFMEYLIASFSKEHDIIIDAFAGAGTSFMVAEDTNRICYGAEINTQYCKEIIELWEEATGQKAQKVE